MSTVLISYAQHAEDVLLHRALGHLAEGFWVDVGAGDPEVDSVTALFAAKGWRGINIEPDPEACARLAAARPRDITLCCAAGAAPGRAVLHRIAGTGLSTLDPAIAARHAAAGHRVEPIEVGLRTLAEICAAHAPPEIHFLKIDAEGHEAEVLAGADFTRHRPWVVVVEATEPNLPTPSHAAWEPQLLAAGYEPVLFDGLNRWYLAAERAAALRGAFSAPANPLDRFLRRAELALRQRAEAAEAAARAAEEATRTMRAEAEEAARARASAAAQAAAETARADAATARAAALADHVAAAEQRAALAEQRAAAAEQEAARAADRARTAEARAAAAEEERRAAARRAESAEAQAAAAEAQARSAADRAALAQQRAEAAEQQASEAQQRARAAEDRAAAAEALAAGHARRLAAAETERHTTLQQLAAAQAERDAALARAAAAEADAAAAQARIAALLASRSWRITRPLRVLGHGLRGRVGLALMEAGVPRPKVEAWKQAWQARRRRGGAGLLASPPPPAAPAARTPPPADPTPSGSGKPVLCLDVTLTLRHGGRPAVGLVRVEHDIARHLLGLAEAEVLPVLCGPDGRYRLAEAEETTALAAILEGRAPPAPPPAAPVAGEALGDVLHTLGRLAALAPTERQDLARRLARGGRLPGWMAAALVGGGMLAARTAHALLARRGPPAAAPPPTGPARPLPVGAVLVSAGNQWDYVDYAALAREVQAGRLSLVTVLYDVIAADLPWTTPAPPDLYHRHWVEIGHLSSRLVAISEHTARQYRALIAEPNLLAVPIEACPLPLAFVARAAALSPVPVPALMGRRFVLYVSTIETRKNHLLLLHAWDRLLRELPPEQVPQLVFVGAWGWGTEATRLMVERNWRLTGHLHVLTGVPDETLLWLYRHALFAVFPALAEGFGLGAAEAVALGTPCLISDCPALIEATQGLMPALDPLDLPGWVAELRRLFTDAAALAELRARTASFRPLPADAFARAVAQAALAVAAERYAAAGGADAA